MPVTSALFVIESLVAPLAFAREARGLDVLTATDQDAELSRPSGSDVPETTLVWLTAGRPGSRRDTDVELDPDHAAGRERRDRARDGGACDATRGAGCTGKTTDPATSRSPAGRVSVTVTSVAVFGPAFLTTIAKAIVSPGRALLGPDLVSDGFATAFSDVLDDYGGGPGRIAIHGRGGASLRDPLGTARSHGCLRVANPDVSWLVRHVPRGTPVNIRP